MAVHVSSEVKSSTPEMADPTALAGPSADAEVRLFRALASFQSDSNPLQSCRIEYNEPDGKKSVSGHVHSVGPAGEVVLDEGLVIDPNKVEITKVEAVREAGPHRLEFVPIFDREREIKVSDLGQEISKIVGQPVEVTYRLRDEPDKPGYYMKVLGSFDPSSTESHLAIKKEKDGQVHRFDLEDVEIVSVSRTAREAKWERHESDHYVRERFPKGASVSIELREGAPIKGEILDYSRGHGGSQMLLVETAPGTVRAAYYDELKTIASRPNSDGTFLIGEPIYSRPKR